MEEMEDEYTAQCIDSHKASYLHKPLQIDTK